MSEQALIDALEKLTDKIDEMSGNLGRGTKAKTSQVPGGKAGINAKTPEEKNAAKSMDNLDKMARAGIKTQKESNKANEEQTDSVKGLTKSQKNATEEQRKLERSMERAKEGFIGFGQSLFKEKTNVADALGTLGGTLSRSTGIVGRSFGGMATGIGLALGLMQNFADSARELGSFADLGAFQLGSVRQAKVLSGLGDSFIKVIEQSNGGFKGLGGTSQQAVENLSNLSRSFRYGSSSLTSTMKKSLGTDLIKTVDKTSNAIAAMGLSQADQATLEASILSTTMMTAKNEDDAKKKFVIAMGQSTASARGLSDTFGVSAKKINEAMAEFRGTQAGKVAALSGGVGGAEFFAYLKENMSSFTSNPQELANLSSAIAEGNMSKAQKAISSNPEATQSMQRTFRAAQGTITDKGFDAAQFGKNLQLERGAAEAQYAGVKDQQGFNDKLVAPVLDEMLMFKKMNISTGLIEPDAKVKPEIKTSELQNIESMNSLTAALESLRGTLIGISAGILGLTGAIGGLVLAGGIGALATGGGGMLGKLGSAVGGMIPGKWNPMSANQGPKLPGTGGIAGKAGALMGGVGEKAGGMFSKLGGAASDGMSSFGDFLGKLGDNKAIKGAGTLALLGGALALAAHGFKTFGDVTWEGMLKGTIALGGLIGIAKLLDKGSNSILKGAGVIAILGASLAVSAVGFKVFNEVNWGSLVKGTIALGGLVAIAKLLDKGSISILKGAAVIGLLGAAMWVAGKGFQTFNDLDWGGIAKGAVALGVFAVAAGVMGGFLPVIAAGALAIALLGASLVVFGAGAMVAAKAAQMFSEAIVTIGSIDGANLIAVGAGLAAVGAGMIVFTAGMIAGTAGSVVSGIMSLFGAKSPLERIKDFVPYADKISILGAGIKAFGDGITAIATNVASFDTDALGKLKDKLLEFAAAGSSDEVKLTAEYLSSISTSLGAIANIGDIKLPSMSSMGNSPSISTDISSSLSPGESVVNDKSGSSLTPEAIAQLMSYLSSMQNDLAAIRGNTKSDGFTAPVRLS